MKTHAVRINEPLYEALRVRAEAERRSLTQQTNLLLEEALQNEHTVQQAPPEPWPDPPKVKGPSAEERDWATGEDPPELTPDDVETKVFVPVADTPESVAEKAKRARAIMEQAERHFKPDPKGKK